MLGDNSNNYVFHSEGQLSYIQLRNVKTLYRHGFSWKFFIYQHTFLGLWPVKLLGFWLYGFHMLACTLSGFTTYCLYKISWSSLTFMLVIWSVPGMKFVILLKSGVTCSMMSWYVPISRLLNIQSFILLGLLRSWWRRSSPFISSPRSETSSANFKLVFPSGWVTSY